MKIKMKIGLDVSIYCQVLKVSQTLSAIERHLHFEGIKKTEDK